MIIRTALAIAGPGVPSLTSVLSPIGDFISGHLTEMLSAIAVTMLAVLVKLAFSMVRQLPATLRRLALEAKKRAEATDTPLDDMGVQIVLVLVDALEAALDAEMPKKGKKQ